MRAVIASGAKQSRTTAPVFAPGLLRNFAPRNDGSMIESRSYGFENCSIGTGVSGFSTAVWMVFASRSMFIRSMPRKT
jgi:hypothetical protein